jgi:hypothetical protein
MRSTTTLRLLIAASACLAGCANLKLTVEQCREYCASHGKEMRSFHVGTSVPLINPKPPVNCECAEPAEAPPPAS